MEPKMYITVLAILFFWTTPTMKANAASVFPACLEYSIGGPPTAMICGKVEGKVDKQKLLKMKQIELRGCVSSAKLNGFKMSIILDREGKENVFSLTSESAELTEDMIALIRKSENGRKIYFEDFEVVDATGKEYHLKPVVVTIG